MLHHTISLERVAVSIDAIFREFRFLM